MTRHVQIETSHGDDHGARAVAAAVAPDNTAEVETTADGAVVRTEIERPTTGGVQSTADDYVLNVRVADRILRLARGTLDPSGGAAGESAETDKRSRADRSAETSNESSADAGSEPSDGSSADTESEPTSESDGVLRDDRTERHGGPTGTSDPPHDRS